MKMRVMAMVGVVLAAGLAAAAAGCRSTRGGNSAIAEAVLAPKSGSKLAGRAVFRGLGGNWIHLHVEVSGIAPGLHAVHIHETGDCSAPDAKSAGGHWNPTGRKHGMWGRPDGEFHLGDIGNIDVGADGKGSIDVTTDLWTVGGGAPTDVMGRSIVVHAKGDDFTTQPTGDAGDRLGCGPIGEVSR